MGRPVEVSVSRSCRSRSAEVKTGPQRGPQTVNQPVQTADEIIQGILYGFAVEAAISALDTQFPFLAWPFVSEVLKMLVTSITTVVYAQLKNFVNFQIIDFQVASEKKEYLSAENELRAAHASGDPTRLEHALTDYKSALASIIHYDGA